MDEKPMTTGENTVDDALVTLVDDNRKRREKLFQDSRGMVTLEPQASNIRMMLYLQAIAEKLGIGDEVEHDYQIFLSKMLDANEVALRQIKEAELKPKLHTVK